MLQPKLGGRLRFADIRLVIGTRPEAIKIAPLARALVARGAEPTLTFTGQHALRSEEFGLNDLATHDLDCPGREDPHEHVRAVTDALIPHLIDRPDLLVVQGDTSSALGAALAGFTAAVPVAHVEAGLRTFDPALPWPEEEYRTAIDAHASLLFAPTDRAAANLRAEGVPGAIFVTGNTAIDALLDVEARLPTVGLSESNGKRLLVTCHRRESWGDGVAFIASALRAIARQGVEVDVVLHPNEHLAASMRASLAGVPGINLLDPCGHDELVGRMRLATLILSDSGGIQEEAPALGIPLLILRDRTERPEGILSGNSILVGRDPEAIRVIVDPLLSDNAAFAQMSRPSLPFGDGRASSRIAAAIEDYLRRNCPEAEMVTPTGLEPVFSP